MTTAATTVGQEVTAERSSSIFGRLGRLFPWLVLAVVAGMTIFPIIMLVGYIGLILYFASRGGYHAQVLVGHEAEDKKFTGGVEGPADM